MQIYSGETYDHVCVEAPFSLVNDMGAERESKKVSITVFIEFRTPKTQSEQFG